MDRNPYTLLDPDGLRQLSAQGVDLSSLDFHTLWKMRENAGRDKALQNWISPYEHRAMAREATTDNPLMALPLAVATPLYQVAKLLGQTNSRSAPSWSQMGHGLLGVGEGLLSRLK